MPVPGCGPVSMYGPRASRAGIISPAVEAAPLIFRCKNLLLNIALDYEMYRLTRTVCGNSYRALD